LFFAPFTGYDKNPFWMFFSFWQIYLHTPLLNLKVPGFVSAFWREELMVFTLRNEKVHDMMLKLSKTTAEEQKSYNLLFEVGGFTSVHILVNLGIIIWILAIIIGLIVLGGLIDLFCSVPDPNQRIQGLRKPVSEKPLHMLAINMLVRYMFVSILDFAICVFVTLSADTFDVFDDVQRKINISVSYGLVGMFGCLFIFILMYGLWRYLKSSKAKIWKDYEVTEYVSTLFDGMQIQHPTRTTVYLIAFLTRNGLYAATTVFLYEQPIF
jgi:hypothetical protein